MGADEARGVFLFSNDEQEGRAQRRWAVEGLGRLDDPGMVPGLIKDFLREPDPVVQLAYCFALANLGNREFVDRVALDLGNKKRRHQARAYAVELGDDLLDELVGVPRPIRWRPRYACELVAGPDGRSAIPSRNPPSPASS